MSGANRTAAQADPGAARPETHRAADRRFGDAGAESANRITGLGSHDELIEKYGSYTALWRRWHG